MSRQIQASTRDIDGPLLELTDVKTHFKTARGLVRAVDGVSFTLERGKALGVEHQTGEAGPDGGGFAGARGRAAFSGNGRRQLG